MAFHMIEVRPVSKLNCVMIEPEAILNVII